MSSRFLNPNSLPRPPNYGYLPQGTQPIESTQVNLPSPQDPQSPSDVQYQLQQYAKQQQIPMPDIVKVKYAAGDPAMVRKVFDIANGADPETNGLFGYTQQDALTQLQQWGYPTDANTWTADQWNAAIATAAQQPNLLSMLGYQ